MDKLCEILAGLDRNTIVIGDFNLPGIDWTRGTSDKKGRKLLDTVSEQSLIQLVDCPTHDKGNILDLLITNCPEIVLNISSETKLGKSDHCVLNVELDVNVERNITVSSKPNWSKMDEDGLKKYLRGQNWQVILRAEDVEENWAKFRSILNAGVSKFVPMSSVRSNSKPKWINME